MGIANMASPAPQWQEALWTFMVEHSTDGHPPATVVEDHDTHILIVPQNDHNDSGPTRLECTLADLHDMIPMEFIHLIEAYTLPEAGRGERLSESASVDSSHDADDSRSV